MYSVYRLVYSTKKEEEFVGYFKVKMSYKSFYIYRLIGRTIVLALAVLDIVGRYTFYAPIYNAD